jgi:hypothetical protein
VIDGNLRVLGRARAPSFSVYKINWLACILSSVKTGML